MLAPLGERRPVHVMRPPVRERGKEGGRGGGREGGRGRQGGWERERERGREREEGKYYTPVYCTYNAVIKGCVYINIMYTIYSYYGTHCC